MCVSLHRRASRQPNFPSEGNRGQANVLRGGARNHWMIWKQTRLVKWLDNVEMLCSSAALFVFLKGKTEAHLKECLFFFFWGGGDVGVKWFSLNSCLSLLRLRLSELIRKYSVSQQGLSPTSAQGWLGHLGACGDGRCLCERPAAPQHSPDTEHGCPRQCTGAVKLGWDVGPATETCSQRVTSRLARSRADGHPPGQRGAGRHQRLKRGDAEHFGHTPSGPWRSLCDDLLDAVAAAGGAVQWDERWGGDPAEPPDRCLPALPQHAGDAIAVCLEDRAGKLRGPAARWETADVRAMDPYLWQPAEINK